MTNKLFRTGEAIVHNYWFQDKGFEGVGWPDQHRITLIDDEMKLFKACVVPAFSRHSIVRLDGSLVVSRAWKAASPLSKWNTRHKKIIKQVTVYLVSRMGLQQRVRWNE